MPEGEDPLPFQSFLFVPGDRPERFDKALASGADAVIVDLEDAVSPDAKIAARSAVSAWVSNARPVLVRVNAYGTPWFAEDIMLANLAGVAGIVLPKVECAADIAALAETSPAGTAVYPLIETGKGLWNALEIAKAPFVKQLLFGTLDFIADMGMDTDAAELNTYRAQLALVSRVANLDAPIDGVTPPVDDTTRLTLDTLNGKHLGFGGKLCIHPKQVSTVNRCYRPSDKELESAKRILEAASRANGAAVIADGKMVDLPVVLRAQRLVASAKKRNRG